MQRFRICIWLGYVIVMGVITQHTSCKKIDDQLVIDNPPRRIMSIVVFKNGSQHTRDDYHYRNGELSMHYAYISDHKQEWELSGQSVYHCWSNNFMSTDYIRSGSGWMATKAIMTRTKLNTIAVTMNQFTFLPAMGASTI